MMMVLYQVVALRDPGRSVPHSVLEHPHPPIAPDPVPVPRTEVLGRVLVPQKLESKIRLARHGIVQKLGGIVLVEVLVDVAVAKSLDD